MTNTDALTAAGFVSDAKAKDAIVKATAHMHESGPYVVQDVLTKGDVTLMFEQNTADENLGGGLVAKVTHPAVCVVSSPKGRVTCNAADVELILAVASDLS